VMCCSGLFGLGFESEFVASTVGDVAEFAKARGVRDGMFPG
jgi:hypothetical protein